MSLIGPNIDLGPVVETLATRFASVADRHRIIDLVSTTADQFANARIREYIPVLVQHICDNRLRQLSNT